MKTGPLTLTDGFTVNALSRVESVTPASARREDAVVVTLSGVNTAWGSGSGAVFGEGITVSGMTCATAIACEATLTLEPLARLGLRDVTVITQGQTAHGFGLFSVLPKAQIDAVFPDHATQGETLVVIGRSGEGKSVLLKNIVRLLEPDEGDIWIEGTEISELPKRPLMQLRRKFGFLFQGAALFDSMTISKNIGLMLFERVQIIFD